WLGLGVCLAAAVQDMVDLAASVRRNGRSLAAIARSEIGPSTGATASLAILFVGLSALSGLGMVVVKALGGEEIKLSAGTVLEWSVDKGPDALPTPSVWIPPGTRVIYPNGNAIVRSEQFVIHWPENVDFRFDDEQTGAGVLRRLTLPAGVTQLVPGSSWGTFTIACTIPIALFTGLYMYRIRPGKVVEASLIGGFLTLVAV